MCLCVLCICVLVCVCVCVCMCVCVCVCPCMCVRVKRGVLRGPSGCTEGPHALGPGTLASPLGSVFSVSAEISPLCETSLVLAAGWPRSGPARAEPATSAVEPGRVWVWWSLCVLGLDSIYLFILSYCPDISISIKSYG